MPLQKEERRTVTHERAENGFIVSLTIEKTNKKGFNDFKTKKYIAKSAIETNKLLKELIQ